MAAKMVGQRFLGKVASRIFINPVGQNFVKIALSLTIYEVNAFFGFTQKFKMAAKNGGKMVLEKLSVDSAPTLSVKNLVKITLTVYKLNAFLHFTQKFKMAAKKGRESDFCLKSLVDSADTLVSQNFV